MIKRFFSIVALALAVLAGGCTDLDVEIRSDLTTDNFPTTESQLAAASGAIYSAFASAYGQDWWVTAELSSDSSLLTATGGNFYDRGMYMECALHSWTPNTGGRPAGMWNWLYRTINTCNSVYDLLAAAPDTDAKATGIAELRVMRAMCYFFLIDIYGGAPLVTKFGEAVKARNTRAELFSFVEKEVLECAPLLNPGNDVTTYSRPNQMTAYALLAKLYMNAEVYIGTPMWTKALEMCDKVIAFEAGGAVGLHDDYLDMFNWDNGPRIKEFIFAIPYKEGDLTSFTPIRFMWGRRTPQALGFRFSASSPMKVLPAYYDLFTEDPNDVREKTFMKEQLTDAEGNPLYYNGVPLYHQKDMGFVDEIMFEVGASDLDYYKGYRSNKYPPSPTQVSNNSNSDLPVFRYADILLLKAEAILRGAQATGGDTPLSLVNRVRVRSGCAPWDSVNLEKLFDERGRELCFEAWRRNDLIRFGKYEDDFYEYKVVKKNTDPARRLMPIPRTEIEKNIELEQNPGYTM